MARARKTLEQQLIDIDEKIAFYENKIAELKTKREELLAPSPAEIIAMAKSKGMTITDIMDMLGVNPNETAE
jgi:hypothetical protein